MTKAVSGWPRCVEKPRERVKRAARRIKVNNPEYTVTDLINTKKEYRIVGFLKKTDF